MAKGKKSIWKFVLVGLVVLIVIGALGSGGSGGSTDGSSFEEPQAQQAQEPKPEPYTVSDEALDGSNPYYAYITGTLTNNTEDEKSYIQVSYNLYDADGAQIGTALANTNNLKAGGTWKFEAISTVEPAKVATWERADVSGF